VVSLIYVNPQPPRDAVRQQQKKYFKRSFQFSIVTVLKKYRLSKILKFNNLGNFQTLKLRTLIEKILPISLNLNLTANTLHCYRLTKPRSVKIDPFREI